MPSSVRVLLLEDDQLDAELVRRALEQHFAELVIEHAQTQEQYVGHLQSERYDVVLSDSGVPGCEGLKAFHVAREIDPQIAFIYISGYDDPDRDVQGLKALGVSDFISKTTLDRVGPAVSRALRDAQHRNDVRLFVGYERLVSAVRELSLARDLRAIMRIARRVARELTGAAGATFVLREGDLCHYADEDAIGPLLKGQKFPMRRCIGGWAMLHRQPAVVSDIYADPRISLASYESTFVRSMVMVPIRAMDPIGAIGAYWAERRVPDPRAVRLMQALADTTAVALENVRIYAELEARVQERTAELEAFGYAVSHDLRAPLRHIAAFASILLDDPRAQVNEFARHGLGHVKSASTRMGEMMDALLELSRTSQAPVRRQWVDLAQLGREIAAICNETAARAVQFIAPESLPAEGDPRLLRVALQNLLGNAWKFSGKQDAPRVELGVQAQPGAQRVYFVQDNGVGFDESAASSLFGVFKRLHRQEDFPGNGVGLASVQRIVKKHGGAIWASGKPGQGATFYFTLGDGVAAA